MSLIITMVDPPPRRDWAFQIKYPEGCLLIKIDAFPFRPGKVKMMVFDCEPKDIPREVKEKIIAAIVCASNETHTTSRIDHSSDNSTMLWPEGHLCEIWWKWEDFPFKWKKGDILFEPVATFFNDIFKALEKIFKETEPVTAEVVEEQSSLPLDDGNPYRSPRR